MACLEVSDQHAPGDGFGQLSFTPAIVGTKQIANFTTSSLPQIQAELTHLGKRSET